MESLSRLIFDQEVDIECTKLDRSKRIMGNVLVWHQQIGLPVVAAALMPMLVCRPEKTAQVRF